MTLNKATLKLIYDSLLNGPTIKKKTKYKRASVLYKYGHAFL